MRFFDFSSNCWLAIFLLSNFSLVYFTLAEEKSEIKSISVLNVDREIDISKSSDKQTLVYEIENLEKSTIGYFLQAIDADKTTNVSYVGFTFPSKDLVKEVEKTAVSTRKNEGFYKITFPEPLAAGKKLKFTVKIEYTHVLKPYPTHILQKDQQLVKYDGNQYVSSAYPVKKQTTVIKLASSSVENYSKLQPVKHDGSKITYGPYENVEAFKTNELTVHYENNSPFLVVRQLVRIVEVSHWGNVAIEEYLNIVHNGAILKGSFSRFEFQRDTRSNDRMPCVKSFKTILPASSKDVYYRDEIGNISTSNLRYRTDAVEMEVRPRFPLFGGWKTNYYIGYNVPSYEYLYHTGNEFGLKMRFIDHIFDNFVADEMTLKIILPEGAKSIKFNAPYTIQRETDELHHTYLDVSGRPVIIAKKQNLVENHIKEFELYYTWDRTTMIREPLMLVAAFYLLFVTVIIFARLDFTIAKETHIEPAKQKSNVVEQQRTETTVTSSAVKKSAKNR